MARRQRSANEPRAIVAAATRIPLNDKKLAKKASARRQQWQEDAWEYFDLFGFVKQALWLMANQIAKVRVFAAVANPEDPDGEPIPVTDPASGVPPEVAQQCVAELARLKGPLGGLPEILRELDMNLEIPGEGYLIGTGAREQEVDSAGKVIAEAQPESWQVRSVSEVDVTGDGVYKVRDEPGSSRTATALDPELDSAIRFWIPHPRFSNLPDSPMRGELEDLETLLILSRQRRGEGKSRLPAGLLLIDSNVTATSPRKSDQDDGSNSSTGDVVLDAIAEAISDAIEDESSAAGLAPVTMRVNVPQGSDVSKMVAKVDLSRSSDQWLDNRVEKLIESVARGLNLPVENVMGHQQTTFANAEQVALDKFYDHTEPRVLLIVDLITTAFLRPQLTAPDERGIPAPPAFVKWAPRIFTWYDASALIAKANTEANADAAHDRLAISDAAYRAAKGYSEDDAPDPLEILIRLGEHRGKISPDFTHALIELLGIPVPVKDGESGSGGGGGLSSGSGGGALSYGEVAELLILRQERAAALAAAAGRNGLLDAIPVRSEPTHTPTAPVVPARLLAREARSNVGRRLMEIDRELRTRLLVLCSQEMTRVLERAGNRARQALPEARALVKRVDAEHVLRTLGPSIVAAGGVTDDALLDGAFESLEGKFMAWGANAQSDALALASELGTGFTVDQRAAFQMRQADDLTEAWSWLREQLTTLANGRMYDPNPAAAIGEFDESMTVPASMIRQAVTRAGGTVGVQTRGKGDAWVSTSTNGGPAGGIGTGQVVGDAISQTGSSVEGYEWTYGPAMRTRPFEPHEELDGLTFVNFDDDVLSNDEGWPEYDFYFPGDHDGCVCDATPIILDGGDLTTSDTSGGDTGEAVVAAARTTAVASPNGSAT